MPQVKVYSTSWCGFCKAEKQFLTDKGVKFEDVDVEADQAEAQKMIELSGQMGVPFTLVTHEDGRTAGVVGFNQAWLVNELKLA